MNSRRHWRLGTKLLLLGIPILLMALISVALSLWASWQLDGGAAAVNEAGRMRMQAYRISLSISTGARNEIPQQVEKFEQSLNLLHHGNVERPLYIPWDDSVRSRLTLVDETWGKFRDDWTKVPITKVAELGNETAHFVANIDLLAAAIETHMSYWTKLMHALQIAMFAFAVLGAVALLYAGYRFVLAPVGLLTRAIQYIQQGDFSARVDHVSGDEFGMLAEGFNGMAERLQSMYRGLEAKVAEKTSELEEKRERLEALYDVTAFSAKANTLEELANGFTQRVGPAVRADAVALRWSDESNQRYLMLASQGLPAAIQDGEQCILSGECFCGTPLQEGSSRIVPIQSLSPEASMLCEQVGFKTVVAIPIRIHERQMGEVNLFYYAHHSLNDAENSLLDAMTSHLAGAMENLRLNALEREAAISQERTLLAGELHDSIAQSLAFLKIQVQLMREALQSGDATKISLAVDEIDAGVRESYSDVRELLVHFRTRANTEDIESALATTLRKFEHQSGLRAALKMQGHGIPLAPDVQMQVLHIVQEALSNIRKHAHASQVWLDVQQQPSWRFEVRDDGSGFEFDEAAPNENRVGLHIMAERAARIGARLEIIAKPKLGTTVVLTLPNMVSASAMT